MTKMNCVGLGFAFVLIATGLETTCLAGPPTAWEEIALMGTGINLGNTFDAPDAVHPAAFTGATLDGAMLTVALPAKSVVMLEL